MKFRNHHDCIKAPSLGPTWIPELESVWDFMEGGGGVAKLAKVFCYHFSLVTCLMKWTFWNSQNVSSFLSSRCALVAPSARIEYRQEIKRRQKRRLVTSPGIYRTKYIAFQFIVMASICSAEHTILPLPLSEFSFVSDLSLRMPPVLWFSECVLFWHLSLLKSINSTVFRIPNFGNWGFFLRSRPFSEDC